MTEAATEPIPSQDLVMRYNEFVRTVGIQDVRVTHAEMDLTAAPGVTEPLWFTFSTTVSGPFPIEGYPGFVGQLTLESTFGRTRPNDEREQLGTLQVQFSAAYTCQTLPDEEIGKLFREINLPANLWAYARVFVGNALQDMGLSKFVLPVLFTQAEQPQPAAPTAPAK